ncbi:ArdC family protein [Primorskyibacter flagellatus]|uniref:Antirestriction protein ArdC n=1 Tax=Primorskyibacter flagellatus TaxID=1387277 RepID=A0A1W2DYN8_9RHOB|nr:ArdC-like ssDNA-binding domain-containing protein [Primorskyibacter flagellatus]SMD02563.1 Antirestriction protein ArdC [Primorskyibacter flagellatus]
MAKARFDIKQHITDTIIAQIEAGTPPWRKPWTGSASGACFPLRHNGEPYKGINVLMLWATGMSRGFNSARWMTFKQALDLGGCVRKGETSTKSVFYGTFEKDVEGSNGETETRASRFAKYNNVFNADQIDGLPEDYYVRPEPPRDLGTKADAELDAFFAATGAEITTSDDPRAFYDPVKDLIHMPPIGTFFDAAGFYGTLAHECGHYFLAERRIGTQKKFSTKAEYAAGELEAEIFSSFVAIHLGFEPHFDQTASYVEGWLKCLKADKNAIFAAAAQAQKAFDHVLDLTGRSKSGPDEQEAA